MKLFPKASAIITTASAIFLLTACGGGSSDYDFTQPLEVEESAAPHGPIYDPASGDIPTGNNLLFSGSTDGTLNIPNTDNNPLVAAINELDGFSTTMPMLTDFGMPIDQTSLTVGDSVRVFQVTSNAQGEVTGVVRELTAAELMVTAEQDEDSNAILAITPRLPLAESTTYMIVLTNAIRGTDGLPAQAPSAYSIARSSVALTGTDYELLEPLRQAINNIEAVAASQGVDRDTIITSWTMTTQSITPVLNSVADNATARNIFVAPTGQTTNDFVPSFPGIADVSIGTLDIPYYLEAPSTENPTAPLNGYWKGVGGSSLTRFNTTPIANQTLTVPVIMTTPNAGSGQTMPATGWPVVIYQHGITRVRTDVLAYADAMAQAGFAMIAIDLPLHGITDSNNPLHASNTTFPNDVEASFDVDYVNNETGASGPDGIADSSGKHFINLRSMLTSRDNVRQGVANLLTLRQSLVNLVNINANDVRFVAHSLGGIVGVPYLGVESISIPTSLVSAGALIANILDQSASFGPEISAGLASLGVTGSAKEEFLLASQWIIDSADPINFAMDAAAMHPIHLIEVIGDGGTIHLPDQVIPNSSTEILASVMGATAASDPINTVAVGAPRIIRFTQGTHGSVLDPSDGAPTGGSYLNVFTEMHSELVQFQGSGGTVVVITDNSIIQ